MDTKIDSVTILGGGDSGLLTGLCIRKLNPELRIAIVDDFSKKPPNVGKSTYKEITNILHKFLKIDEELFISEVNPIWKGSVYFRDWCGCAPFHFPFDDFRKFPSEDTPKSVEAYYHHYDELYDSPDHRTKGEELVEKGKSPMYFVPEDGRYHQYDHVAYHLDTDRFNSFLRKICDGRNISLVNDRITTVDVDENHIQNVRGRNGSYESDLYIDASGFNRVIKKEVGGEFNNFDLPLDSAFNARTERSLSDIVPATVVETGDNGWFWQIDTFDNRDLGYVFASEFVSDGDALAEFLQHCDGAIQADDVTKYEFTSGYYENAWVENCIAIGNAEGFVEPLQSTGLTANAEAAATLSHLLASHGCINDAGIRETFNSWVRRTWQSIYDFISIHYKYSAGSTDFWRAMQSIELSSRVKQLIREFDSNGFATHVNPVKNNTEIDDTRIFHPINFYVIMRNMGAESGFYEENEFQVSEDVRDTKNDFYRNEKSEVEQFLTVEEVYRGIPELVNRK